MLCDCPRPHSENLPFICLLYGTILSFLYSRIKYIYISFLSYLVICWFPPRASFLQTWWRLRLARVLTSRQPHLFHTAAAQGNFTLYLKSALFHIPKHTDTLYSTNTRVQSRPVDGKPRTSRTSFTLKSFQEMQKDRNTPLTYFLMLPALSTTVAAAVPDHYSLKGVFNKIQSDQFNKKCLVVGNVCQNV